MCNPMIRAKPLADRFLVTRDESGKWYVRRVRSVEQDIDKNEKVYRCDLPLANDLDLKGAIRFMKRYG
jgi:hypothetical protein